MADKLTSRQQAQLAFLQTLPPKIERFKRVIEEMGSLQADEQAIKGMCRLLNEVKSNASQLSLAGLADTLGLMSNLARRGGGLQMRVRGLRELLGSLKINYDAELRNATTVVPERPSKAVDPLGSS